MKRYNLCTAIIDRVLPAFIALALLTTCRNGGDPSRTEIRSTPESTNGNGRATASGNSSATEEKALLSIYEYNKLDTVFMEDFPAIEEPEEDTVCVVTHRMPSFPGGYDSLTAFIRRNARYPSKAEQENIRGVTWIKCVIDKKGNVVRPEVLVSLSPECDREALRIVRSMPRWEPGMIDRCKPYVKLNGTGYRCKRTRPLLLYDPGLFPAFGQLTENRIDHRPAHFLKPIGAA
ncbi:energy transducer TonB [Alistipes ihumii]|uniref:energy transducer TonB n=1 Tax=Alistipes ihumii TaxID=1470347 RepID=UPI003AF5C339